MKRLVTITLFSLALGACSSAEDRARQVLEDTLSIKDQLEVSQVNAYPGGVICGAYSATTSYHEGRRNEAPFIVRGDRLDLSPSSRDWRIFCDPDPSAALLAQTGIGPFSDYREIILKVTQDFSTMGEALEAYYQDTSEFPTTEQGLAALQQPAAGLARRKHYREGGYLAEIPRDPWGRPYLYEHERWAGIKGRFSITTLGESGSPGGEGADTDISYDELPYLEHVARALGPN